MAGRVWNYLSGYVMIELKGRGLERFVNRAAQSGVPLWGIRRTAADAITTRTSIEGFYALHTLLRGTGLRVRILDKRGLPIALSRFRGREALLFGWILVAALIVAASRFIWYISVDGCDTVSEAQIISTLAELGVETGSARSGTATFDLGGKIMQSDSRIAWAGVRLEGVILRVSIVEADPYAPEDTGDEPGSLIAKKDGVIVRVLVEGGKARVVAGDAVFAGQMLITGVIRNDELGYIVTRARGAVIARVVYCVSASAGPMLTQPARAGESEKGMRVSLFGLTLGGAQAGREEVITGKWRLTNCFLPLAFEAFESYALEDKPARATPEALEARANSLAEGAALARIPAEAAMLSKKSEAVLNDDGSVTVTVTIVTEENIAELRGLNGN